MIKSMTGFGKADVCYGTRLLRVEIKSLNNKQIDMQVRLPAAFRDHEMAIRNEVTRALMRGKIDVFISCDAENTTSGTTLQTQVAVSCLRQIRDLAAALDMPVPDDVLSIILRLPEVIATSSENEPPCPWEVLSGCLAQALRRVNDFRLQEGCSLGRDLAGHIQQIQQLSDSVENLDANRIVSMKARLARHLEDSGYTGAIDRNRFEQELVYHMERLDMNEEKVRLNTHLRYFTQVLQNEENAGRKLGFVAQEIGREINTMGSKANDADIQRVVVAMKDELEKIKEQILNIL